MNFKETPELDKELHEIKLITKKQINWYNLLCARYKESQKIEKENTRKIELIINKTRKTKVILPDEKIELIKTIQEKQKIKEQILHSLIPNSELDRKLDDVKKIESTLDSAGFRCNIKPITKLLGNLIRVIEEEVQYCVKTIQLISQIDTNNEQIIIEYDLMMRNNREKIKQLKKEVRLIQKNINTIIFKNQNQVLQLTIIIEKWIKSPTLDQIRESIGKTTREIIKLTRELTKITLREDNTIFNLFKTETFSTIAISIAGIIVALSASIKFLKVLPAVTIDLKKLFIPTPEIKKIFETSERLQAIE